MKLEVTEILKRLEGYSTSDAPMDNIVLAMNQTRGSVLNRIFNSEDGTKDISGRGLGGYSNSYAQYRRKKGRQAGVVDLEFTGSLRRDIKVVRDGDRVLMAIVSNSERLKSSYLEQYYKQDIFSIAPEEQNEFYKTLNTLFQQDIKFILTGES